MILRYIATHLSGSSVMSTPAGRLRDGRCDEIAGADANNCGSTNRVVGRLGLEARRIRWEVRVISTDRVPGRPDLTDLVGAACAGDESAFRLLYREVQPGLLRHVQGLVGDEAEDVASEA